MIKVIKGGMNVLTNLTKEEKEKIKKDLTLENPMYKQIKQFSKYNYTSVPPFLTYYMSQGDELIIPRGYSIPFEHEVIEDNRVEVPVDYPDFKIELREEQRRAVDAWGNNREKGTIVLATGKGKTITACYLSYMTRQRTLIIVHKTDLFVSWKKDIELALGINPKDIGVIQAGKYSIGDQFTVATIQTLTRLPLEKLQELYNTFGMIIVDESHRACAKSYEILRHFQAKYMIGLTATDMRADGLIELMYWLFGEVCYRSEYREDDEDIMPYKVIVRESNLKYNPPQMYYYKNKVVNEYEAQILMEQGETVKRKPLDPQALRDLLKDDEFNRLVAKDIIKEYVANKSIVAFLHEKEHIRTLRDILIKFGANESDIGLFYGDAKEKDEDILRKAENGEYKITLATFAKATEGTNVKRWDTAFLVTSINDEKNTEQAVGRIRRRMPDKKECIVYDYTHPNVKGMRNHINTRMKVYKKHKATIEYPNSIPTSKGILFRGFKKSRATF